MSLSRERLENHIGQWEVALRAAAFSYRDRWPSRLFHHAPVENAVEILRSGQLLSRRDSERYRPLDVAGRDVINSRDDAHRFARLYFRPRTPTQFHIEGIRKPAEYYHGEVETHAPILIMLIFDARSVFGRDGIYFSNGNMQSPWTEFNDTDEFFDTIEFAKVYHDSAHSDKTITWARCAEVLSEHPLALDGALQWVCCRSHAEKATLIHLLGDAAAAYHDKIIVSDDLRVFDKRFTYAEEVGVQPDGVTFRLSPRRCGGDILVQVDVELESGELRRAFGPGVLAATPIDAKRWIARTPIPAGNHKVLVRLEDCRAFEAVLRLDEEPF